LLAAITPTTRASGGQTPTDVEKFNIERDGSSFPGPSPAVVSVSP